MPATVVRIQTAPTHVHSFNVSGAEHLKWCCEPNQCSRQYALTSVHPRAMLALAMTHLDRLQPFPFRDAKHNHDELRVVEFKEILKDFKNLQAQAIDVGLYIEIKHPEYHAELVRIRRH